MKFRPCIDIHNGKVKQIIGGSLLDQGDQAEENFVSAHDAGFYGKLYKKNQLSGGHVILLNAKDSPYYEADRMEAVKALEAFPGGLQAGGGITDENAAYFIHKGASHVIVTSFVFSDGEIRYDRLERLRDAVGREHLVLDLSCRKKEGDYYVVTDRWQKFTKEKMSGSLLKELEVYCDEFLIHGVDVEGKSQGIDHELVKILAQYQGNPLTYAGGVRSFEDLELLKKYGKSRIDVTIGSALDLFGGPMEFSKVLSYCGQ
ncbi:phosphoribosylformimino-5-aminoimidazole carboxamide ribotide isomerase [Anaerostipes sp.]|uniref:phosphoribosylformimino-5-aminoimidazole carboxamide ribotide isomerase n=1 Tax=Anaerostipes sp. TaxID=1872530 RepID=UPI002580A3A4|nr:phosphoribosylformimino-5-aminoimidazole carboxamide ribotide isomerase [Anaerostipes sp.]